MVTRSHVTLSSELHDLNINSLDRNDGHGHPQKGIKDSNLELGIWIFILPNLFLEILVLRFDQMASPQEPEYGLVVWGLCMAMMFVCGCELIYKGLIKEKLTLLQCLKSLFPCCSSGNNIKNPYSFMDGLILLGAKIQTAFASIAYAYLRQGKENRIKVSFVSLIFIVFFIFAKLVKNRKEAHLLPVRGGDDN